MTLLAGNPEFLRYWRSQFRLSKILPAAVITLLLSAAIAFTFVHRARPEPLVVAGRELLFVCFYTQIVVLAIGGGIACLLAISSEKEQNTFDFQRVTSLTPLELALGKLFGAPLFMYFICLCLAPVTIYATLVSNVRGSAVLAAYGVLVVASMTFHAFNLLLSMLAIKGAQLSGLLVSLILLVVSSALYGGNNFRLRSLSPFEAVRFIEDQSSLTDSAERYVTSSMPWLSLHDVFFGHTINHFPVLVVLDLLFTFWFLLAVVRNIKRDTEYYELYSPRQFLGFALFLNLILVAFHYFPETSNGSVLQVDSMGELNLLFLWNMFVFFLLGLALLRSRSRIRTLLRSPGANPSLAIQVLWPAPILAVGTFLAAVVAIVDLHYTQPAHNDWELSSALYRALFFVFWILCNIQFLQCMNLRPGKHRLVLAIVYLAVYYICAIVVLSAIGDQALEGKFPIASLFLPVAIFTFDSSSWAANHSIWLGALLLEIALLGLFLHLQSRELRNLLSAPSSSPSASS